MIRLKLTDYQAMVEHARARAPEETCGLLGGIVTENGDKLVEKVYLLENPEHSCEHFSLSPAEQLQAIKELRARGWRLLGNWHSHPASPARPSEEDIRLAYDSTASYLILSLMDRENPVLRAFRVRKDQVQQEQIDYV